MLLFCFFVQNASAKNFDIYVDKGVKAEGDGSKESPYETISQALTEALSKSVDKRNIFVVKGSMMNHFCWVTLCISAELGEGKRLSQEMF